MADPVGIIASGLHAIHKVYDVYQKIKSAPGEIQALREDAAVLEGVLPKIKEVLAREPDSGSIAVLVSRAQELIASVEKFIEAATKAVEGRQKVKKVRWMFKSDEANELVERFRRFYGSFSDGISDYVQSSLSRIERKLQGSSTVEARIDKLIVVQENRLRQLEPIIRTIMSYEIRMRASEQRRGENLAFDQSSVYYDSDHLSEESTITTPRPRTCHGSHVEEERRESSSTSIASSVTRCSTTHSMPPLRGCLRGCGCRCHRVQVIQGMPDALAAICGKLYVKLPFPRRLWPGLVQCDVEACKKDWLMDVKYYFPSWFVQIEMDVRFEALPVHFYIRTPRIVPNLAEDIVEWFYFEGADPNELRRCLAFRHFTVNDIDPNGHSILHYILQYGVLNQDSIAHLADVLSICLDAGAQSEWQDECGNSLIDFAMSTNILRSRQLDHKVLSLHESLIIRPLFHESLHEIWVRLGFTELHQHVCPAMGLPPLTPQVIDSLLPQLNMRDWSGHTPLYYAIRHAPHTVRLLLDAGADIRLVLYPLHLAVQSSDSGAIEPLVRAGVDANERDWDGKTPLIYVTRWTCCPEPFRQITELARCADDTLDWNARDKQGYTALDYALERGQQDSKVIRLLKRHLDFLEHDRGSIMQGHEIVEKV
ncbi:hypothetical protein PHLCEN_2v356 [Hermanssonia centrifuga]|uniref:Uncharacterized protein n=1 Tax=Hermanssonia centrifuga TaxID=98765 RepID=A0A2R6S6F4_9APHY|nr:hypothetical protein PHLCEN_2v356 [Hermanssonia centrifuga]